MNLRTLASASALAFLFSGAIAGQANAQVFAPVTFAVDAAGDITGTGSGLTLSGTGTSSSFLFGGDIIDPLASLTATDGPYSFSGTGALFISGDLVSFTDGLFSLNFTATPTPAVAASLLTPFGGTNGVVTFPNAVPEPGSVAMLAGLAIAGSGFVSRRLRRRSA